MVAACGLHNLRVECRKKQSNKVLEKA
jgi:hypothetical protein